jgi:polysaccharide biosynthesis/export protein
MQLSKALIGVVFASLAVAAEPAQVQNAAGVPCPDVTGQSPSYEIGPLDVLDVRVWGDEKFSGLFPVRPDGMITMPLVGEIRAAGSSVLQLQQSITAKLTTFIIDPVVNVQVPKVNSKNFYIEGGVGRPAEYQLLRPITVLDALSAAGGFRDFAKKDKIYILRGTQQIKFNYKQVVKGQHMEQNIPVLNGDHIVVPEN